jgi:hypothetical protein
MKKSGRKFVTLLFVCLSVWVFDEPRSAIAVGEYNGFWGGPIIFSSPDDPSFSETETAYLVIYQQGENELYLTIGFPSPLRLVKSGGSWVLPTPIWLTEPDFSALLTSFVISFQAENSLTGSMTLESEGVRLGGTLSFTKYVCQILKNGSTLSGLSGGKDSVRCYEIDLQSGATNLKITTWSGSGDCDLEVIYHRPNFDEYISDDYGNKEQVNIAAPYPGRWYIALYGFNSYSGLNLSLTYTPPSPSPAPMPWIPLLLLPDE